MAMFVPLHLSSWFGPWVSLIKFSLWVLRIPVQSLGLQYFALSFVNIEVLEYLEYSRILVSYHSLRAYFLNGHIFSHDLKS